MGPIVLSHTSLAETYSEAMLTSQMRHIIYFLIFHHQQSISKKSKGRIHVASSFSSDRDMRLNVMSYVKASLDHSKIVR